MIKIKQYEAHYNHKDGMYYVDKSYPQKRNKKDYHKKDKCCGGNNNEINININSDRGNGDERRSAFKAISNANQPVVPSTNPTKVLFQSEEFDLNNEYNPTTSTFIPARDGVYSLTAAVGFLANNLSDRYNMYVVFRINGQDVVGGDIEYHELGTVGTGTIILGVVIANTDILQLNAGDQVEVYFYSTVPGSIIGTAATRFAGYRVTSSTV